MLATFIDWMLHLDVYLAALTAQYGPWIYLILFMVIFVETGLVVMPFLPGDSLLFVCGAMCATGLLDPLIVVPLLLVAAISGDAVNYSIGAYVRGKGIDTGRIPLLKPAHLVATHEFFERHGAKTIVLARFVPIVRTLAPFVAALGSMRYRTFMVYNISGALLWIISLTALGYAFGNVPWVSKNLTAVLMGLIVLSIMPGIIAWLSSRFSKAGAVK